MNVRDLVPWVKGDRERTSAQSGWLGAVVNWHREMNRLIDDMFRGFDANGFLDGRGNWPSTDAEETDKEYRITANYSFRTAF
jgi:HSP20 family protein